MFLWDLYKFIWKSYFKIFQIYCYFIVIKCFMAPEDGYMQGPKVQVANKIIAEAAPVGDN